MTTKRPAKGWSGHCGPSGSTLKPRSAGPDPAKSQACSGNGQSVGSSPEETLKNSSCSLCMRSLVSLKSLHHVGDGDTSVQTPADPLCWALTLRQSSLMGLHLHSPHTGPSYCMSLHWQNCFCLFVCVCVFGPVSNLCLCWHNPFSQRSDGQYLTTYCTLPCNDSLSSEDTVMNQTITPVFILLTEETHTHTHTERMMRFILPAPYGRMIIHRKCNLI